MILLLAAWFLDLSEDNSFGHTSPFVGKIIKVACRTMFIAAVVSYLVVWFA